MFWIVTGIVVVVLVAAAWVLSGRSKKVSPGANLAAEAKQDDAKGMHELRTRTGQFPGGVG